MYERLVYRLGFWSAILGSCLGAIYLALLIIYFTTEGFAFPPTPTVQLIGGIITFLTGPLMLILFAAILFLPDREGKVLGVLGLCFTVLFTMSVSINRFVQLTVIRMSPDGPGSADLARFLPYSTGSVMFALEILGWGFFLSLAMLSVAPMFGHNKLERAIRWLMVSFALFSLISVVGFATGTPLTAAGFVAWGPLLLAISVLLAVFFYRVDKNSQLGD